MCCVTVYILPPPPHLSADMRRELYIPSHEEELLSTQFSVAQFWYVLVLSYLIIIISINDDISVLHHPLRKSKLTLF